MECQQVYEWVYVHSLFLSSMFFCFILQDNNDREQFSGSIQGVEGIERSDTLEERRKEREGVEERREDRKSSCSGRISKTNSEDIKLTYFEVPILLKFYVTPNLNIEVGPNICGSLSSSPDYIEDSNTRIATGDLKGFDLKVTAGVSYELKNGLYASLRYHLGTSDLAGNFPCKVSAASLTLGYKFNIFKF